MSISDCIFINIHDAKNTGDRASCPADYFPEFQTCRRLDMLDSIPEDGAPLIFGGGGLLHPGRYWDRLEHVSSDNSRLKIIWGAGLNSHQEVKRIYPKWLDHYDLVGLRDFNSPYEWCPCPSCHLREIKAAPPDSQFGIYEHHEHPITGFAVPKMNNSEPDAGKAIEFISRFRTLLTNSFHGAYWALLMGKEVVLFQPFSNRFMALGRNMKLQRKPGVHLEYDGGFLEECLTASLTFHAKVRTLLSMRGIE